MKYLFKKKASLLFILSLLLSSAVMAQQSYKNESLPIDTRVKDLLSKLTLAEKVSLLGYRSQAVPRLGIPAYNWWNEGLHGVARAGEATVFPQAIALAATFNQDLIRSVSDVISTEARAKYNLSTAKDRHLQYMGLTFWTPNINIFRDPRWGRGQETYGEDPYLTSQIGTAFVHGLQGSDPLHMKTASAAKHFVAHSGPEATRDYFDAIVDEKDLRETYMYAFHKLVDGGVESIMTAYNRVNGIPNSVNKHLIQDVLRKEWGFKGHVVTDCGALDDVFLTHKTIPNATETAAAAIKAGIDLDCSSVLQRDVINAIQQKLLTEKEVDIALGRLLKTQFKLGFFDDITKSPYYTYRADSLHTPQHIALARKASQQSMVLLKNSNNLLPLKEENYPAIMVLGPNAANLDAMLGSYHGVSSKVVNFVEGITGAVDPATRVEYDMGCDYRDTTHFGGIWGAGNADLTIAVLGLSPVLEGEAGDAFLAENGGDKKNLSLPASEIAFMKALRKGVKKPIIAVITAGSDVDVSAIADYADAIIYAWYPGEQGGNALADIVFGKVNPSGRLPLTFYNSVNDLPPYQSYSMNNRTYRYFKGKVQYPFGFGLSYTTFGYEAVTLPQKQYGAKDTITITAAVKNIGIMDGDEIVQAYIKYPTVDRMPLKELKAFKRVSVAKGGSETITLKVPVTELQKWDLKNNQWKLYPGTYQLVLGSSSADEKITARFQVK
ncbi:glycoside hydrolase family 3 N-terminal domain-containing protein [Mucilaginibacter phyllosphaerae]|uniref:Beta-glucosidase n=1 Tax=Mucilaginibacter phyllosphaerae TaxID=1812349 RepID=A0A4Y8AK25_9SPHI|nr:glycoside hydrolase family 3 N-terminal domain-containing protein [Mucilaginibacter phyllosphaerae]MBB3968102.1 beta-glucosidase [Mucilaginibacter phyllosphaerae]TEW68875.1 glycosyl hydrolase [Mucilaginibacter phyllosphaerae]